MFSAFLFSSSNNQGGSNGGSGGPSSNGSGNGSGNNNSNVTSENKKDGEKIHVNRYIDQTVLKAGTRWEDVKKVCTEAFAHDFPAVCIPPCFVKEAKDFLKHTKVKIATVIGFPFGNTTTEVKVYETRQAIENGADEIDMVINIGWLKQGDYEKVGTEIRLIKEACGPHGILKVIVETGLLTEDEIRRVTKVVDQAGADYIKTSTGFGPRGASFRDVELFKENSPRLLIKAAGGVRDNEAAEKYIKMGVSRIGTSTGTVLLAPAKKGEEGAQKGTY
jgi:deoxyribose-phosphate aldolase